MSKAVRFCLLYPTCKGREEILPSGKADKSWKSQYHCILICLPWAMFCLAVWKYLSSCFVFADVNAETVACVLYCRGRFVPLGLMQHLVFLCTNLLTVQEAQGVQISKYAGLGVECLAVFTVCTPSFWHRIIYQWEAQVKSTSIIYAVLKSP